jgi:hypothetical protein
MSFYTLKDALDEIHSSERFSLVWYSADVRRNTGGERLELLTAVETGNSHNSWVNQTITVKNLNGDRHYTIHIYLIKRLNGKLVVW